jgi:hypothetical protein
MSQRTLPTLNPGMEHFQLDTEINGLAFNGHNVLSLITFLTKRGQKK